MIFNRIISIDRSHWGKLWRLGFLTTGFLIVCLANPAWGAQRRINIGSIAALSVIAGHQGGAEGTDPGRAYSEGEQQGFACLIVGVLGTLGALYVGGGEYLMIAAGGTLQPHSTGVLYMSLFSTIFTAGCAVGALSVPTAMRWYNDATYASPDDAPAASDKEKESWAWEAWKNWRRENPDKGGVWWPWSETAAPAATAEAPPAPAKAAEPDKSGIPDSPALIKPQGADEPAKREPSGQDGQDKKPERAERGSYRIISLPDSGGKPPEKSGERRPPP
ncbi:MAG: hypothetical protein WCP34_00810 [Pseudomonadota bacterium]